jgi:hypothetical protein
MKIYPRIPTKTPSTASPKPDWIESDAVPRVGEYFIAPMPEEERGDEDSSERFFRIVRVAYMRDDKNQMEAALVLESVMGSSLNDISE